MFASSLRRAAASLSTKQQPVFGSSKTMFAPKAFFSTRDHNMDIEVRYKKVLFHSAQRGWLELDLIIGSFVKNRREYLLDHKKLDELEDITDEENSDLIRWLVEGWEVPEKFANNQMLKELLEYSYSPNKPWYPTAGNQ